MRIRFGSDKFVLIMEDFYNGHGEGFDRWVNRQIKLCWFRPYLVLNYLILAVQNSTNSMGVYGFPNFRSWGNILWTLRWMWMMILEGDDLGKTYRTRKSIEVPAT